MRSEKEMYDLILGYANADENIRAVILNGSRANPNRKPDPFNDFDIVYLVRDLTPCKEKAYYKKPIIKTSAKSSSASAPTKTSFLKITFPSSYAI